MDEHEVLRLARLNEVESWREQTRWAGRRGEIVEADGILRFASATDFPVSFNGVVRLDAGVGARAVLDEAEAWFSARDRGFSLCVEGGGDPDDPAAAAEPDRDLVAEAARRGLTPLGEGNPVMVCHRPHGRAEVPAGVELRWVDDLGTADDFVAVADAAFQRLGMTPGAIEQACADRARLLEPHLAEVVAYEEGEPLACAQVLLAGGIAGVYYVGTIEAASGRGLGDVVTRAVTARGFELGAPLVCLQASPMGAGTYRRMGYEVVGRSTSLVRFPDG